MEGYKMIPVTDAYRENYDRIFRRSSKIERSPYKALIDGSSPSGGMIEKQEFARFPVGYVGFPVVFNLTGCRE